MKIFSPKNKDNGFLWSRTSTIKKYHEFTKDWSKSAISIIQGNDINFDQDTDICNKVHNYQGMCDAINRALGNKVGKETKMKFYKIMATQFCFMKVNRRQ